MQFLSMIGVQGELIREDLREKSPGVVLHLDVNVINVKTCQPMPNVYVELWVCNSTVREDFDKAKY